jgi:hypothetical protein
MARNGLRICVRSYINHASSSEMLSHQQAQTLYALTIRVLIL